MKDKATSMSDNQKLPNVRSKFLRNSLIVLAMLLAIYAASVINSIISREKNIQNNASWLFSMCGDGAVSMSEMILVHDVYESNNILHLTLKSKVLNNIIVPNGYSQVDALIYRELVKYRPNIQSDIIYSDGTHVKEPLDIFEADISLGLSIRDYKNVRSIKFTVLETVTR